MAMSVAGGVDVGGITPVPHAVPCTYGFAAGGTSSLGAGCLAPSAIEIRHSGLCCCCCCCCCCCPSCFLQWHRHSRVHLALGQAGEAAVCPHAQGHGQSETQPAVRLRRGHATADSAVTGPQALAAPVSASAFRRALASWTVPSLCCVPTKLVASMRSELLVAAHIALGVRGDDAPWGRP